MTGKKPLAGVFRRMCSKHAYVKVFGAFHLLYEPDTGKLGVKCLKSARVFALLPKNLIPERLEKAKTDCIKAFSSYSIRRI
jgi:hypothetical protein